jgi:hypothetical protein
VARARALLQQARWEAARAVLAQTKLRLAEGGADDLRPGAEQAARELRLGPRLERTELEAAKVIDGKMDWQVVEDGYAAALPELGVNVDGPAAEVADRIRRLAISGAGCGEHTSPQREQGLALGRAAGSCSDTAQGVALLRPRTASSQSTPLATLRIRFR